MAKQRRNPLDALFENDTAEEKDNGNSNCDSNMVQDRKFYDLLGVATNATTKDISKAYKKQAFKLHPDRNKSMTPEEAAEAFRELTKAYETLRDENLRSMYDNFGETSINGKIDLSKLSMKDLFNLFDDLYTPSENDLKKPPSKVVFIRINDDDINSGCKYISYERKETCSMCGGRGRGSRAHGGHGALCTMCWDEGYIIVNEEFEVKLTNKDRINNDQVFEKKGHVLARYREQGDLVVKIRYWQEEKRKPKPKSKPTTQFAHNNNNNNNNSNNNELKIHKIEISLYEAMYGFNENSRNYNNSRRMKAIVRFLNRQLPIQSGEIFDLGNNLLVKFIVVIPDCKKIIKNPNSNLCKSLKTSIAALDYYPNSDYKPNIERSRNGIVNSIIMNNNKNNQNSKNKNKNKNNGNNDGASGWGQACIIL